MLISEQLQVRLEGVNTVAHLAGELGQDAQPDEIFEQGLGGWRRNAEPALQVGGSDQRLLVQQVQGGAGIGRAPAQGQDALLHIGAQVEDLAEGGHGLWWLFQPRLAEKNAPNE